METQFTKMGKILVTDDDENLRDLMSRALEAQHYQVFEARNGSECLQQIQEEAPDLVVMDIEMPAVRGDTAIRIIRRHRTLREIPIVVISEGRLEPSLEALGIPEHGTHLPKPFRINEFLGCVRDQLVRLDEDAITQLLVGMGARDESLSLIATSAAGKLWNVHPAAREGRAYRMLVPEELTRLDPALVADARLRERVQILAQVGDRWRRVWPRPTKRAEDRQLLSLFR